MLRPGARFGSSRSPEISWRWNRLPIGTMPLPMASRICAGSRFAALPSKYTRKVRTFPGITGSARPHSTALWIRGEYMMRPMVLAFRAIIAS